MYFHLIAALQIVRRTSRVAARASRPSNTPDDSTVDVDGIVKDLQDKATASHLAAVLCVKRHEQWQALYRE